MNLYQYFFCGLFILCLLKLPCTYGQTTHNKSVVHNSNTTKHSTAKQNAIASRAYTLAISEYLKKVYQNGTPQPDTLFIGKQALDRPITLPAKIEGINVMVTTSKAAQNKLSYRKSLVFINVVGWLDKTESEFIIVAFHEFKPQHNCSLKFKTNPVNGDMQLIRLTFDYPNKK
jgi:hypothetical protein